MAAKRRSYSGAAVATNLTSNITSGATTIPVGATTGWPDTTIGPFIITIDRGQSNEEKVSITSFTGSSLTVESGGRGVDGTTAAAHSNNATVEHTMDAQSMNDANAFAATVGSVVPTASAVGDASADGTSAVAAAADHKHQREAFGTAATVSAPGDNEAPGTATTPSRSDHKHGREAAGLSTGMIVEYGFTAAPAGWLLCDGSAVSRTTYSGLFAIIGAAFGGGDGTTTFNVPDLRGRTPVGVGAGPGLTVRGIASSGGEENHLLTSSEMPAHVHEQNGITEYSAVFGSTVGLMPGSSNLVITSGGIDTLSTGGGSTHNNMQPFVALTFIIKT